MSSSFVISRVQALQLGEELIEYARMADTSDREIFKAFRIDFPATAERELRPEHEFGIAPMAEYLEIASAPEEQE